MKWVSISQLKNSPMILKWLTFHFLFILSEMFVLLSRVRINVFEFFVIKLNVHKLRIDWLISKIVSFFAVVHVFNIFSALKTGSTIFACIVMSIMPGQQTKKSAVPGFILVNFQILHMTSSIVAWLLKNWFPQQKLKTDHPVNSRYRNSNEN